MRAPYPGPIRLSLVGIHTTHDSGYTVQRPMGSDEYLFEYFDSPVFLQDEQGGQSCTGNVFILYAPGQPQHFRAEGSLTHTWFQVAGEGVAECIERYRIPVNQVVEIAPPDFLVPLLKEALRQTVRKQRHGEDAVTETIRTLFRRLARALYQSDSVELSPYQKHTLATLHTVRAQVYKDLKRRWTVDDMAALASMSTQRFAVVYRSSFGTGPIDDLIDVRLRHAEVLLRHLPMTVSEVAQHFGFNTVSNFHVLFRERMGRSPRELTRAGERCAVGDSSAEYMEATKRIHLLYLDPVGHWSFDLVDTDVVDDLGKHPLAILQSGVSWTEGKKGGRALLLDGASYAVVPETVIDTSQSYTVCAWLNCHQAVKMTAICIGNYHHGAFYLQYVPTDGGFKFATTISDRDPMAVYVTGSTPIEVGQWHHVVGVYDADKREILLYVNGKREGAVGYETPWRADGATYFGCCQVMDTVIDQWYGAIDDIRMYDRALSPNEIETLYRCDRKQ